MREISNKYIAIVIFFFCYLSIGPLNYARGAEDLYFDVVKEKLPRVRIAVPEFLEERSLTEDETSRKITRILANDLKISGFFLPFENSLLLREVNDLDKEKGGINFQEWLSLGVEALVKGSYSLKKGELKIKWRLYNLFKERELRGKAYTGKNKFLRQIIHKIADEIILEFTGEGGVSGTKIAFVSTAPGSKEVYIIDFDGYNLRRLTWDRSITLNPCWSPDGKRIVYTTYREGNPDLYLLNFRRGRPEPLSIFPGLNATPSWSPGGKRLALTLSKDGNVEVYTLELRKKIFKRLTHHRGIDSTPSWSPNEKEIVFTSDRGGNPQIYLLNLRRRTLRRLTYRGPYNDCARWSPKENLIAFSSLQEGSFDICLIDSEGKNFQRLARSPSNEESPSWSPDGRYLAFSTKRGGKSNIYIINVDGSNERRLTFSGGNNCSPSWSPYLIK